MVEKEGSLKDVSRKFLGYFKGLSSKIEGCFEGVLRSSKGVSRKFQGCFEKVSKDVSELFQESSKVVKRKAEVCLKRALRVFLGSFRIISKNFKECFKEI